MGEVNGEKRRGAAATGYTPGSGMYGCIGDGPAGIECPNCGGRAGHIDNGRVFVCEKGRPLMREARYYCPHCGSTAVFLEKCGPGATGR